jgi:acyl dehydratase
MPENRRYYEDLEEGLVEESSRYTVTAEEILEFAARYDPQYFHADSEAARDSRFQEPIASGIQIMAVWRRLDHEIAHDIAWICGVAWDDVKFPRALRSGDTVFARSKCLSKRISKKDPTRGVVIYEYKLINQDDQVVWSCRSTNLVERRNAASEERQVYNR